MLKIISKNRKALYFICLFLIQMQINSLFLKEKPLALDNKIIKEEPECITIKEIIPKEPNEPKMPENPLAFCKEEHQKKIEEIKGENNIKEKKIITPKIEKETKEKEIILKKEIGKPLKEKIIEKKIEPMKNKETTKTTIIKTPTSKDEKEKISVEKDTEKPKVSERINDKMIKKTTIEEPSEEEKKKIMEEIKRKNELYHTHTEPIEHCFSIEHPMVNEEKIKKDLMERVSAMHDKIEVKPEEKIISEAKEKKILIPDPESGPGLEIKEEIDEAEKPKDKQILDEIKITPQIEGKIKEEKEDKITSSTDAENKKKLPILKSIKKPIETEAQEEKEEEEKKDKKIQSEIIKKPEVETEIQEEKEKCTPIKIEKPKDIFAEHKNIGDNIFKSIKTNFDDLHHDREKWGVINEIKDLKHEETLPKIIEPQADKKFQICKSSGLRVKHCPCAKKALKDKEAKIKGSSFIQLRLNSLMEMEEGKMKENKNLQNNKNNENIKKNNLFPEEFFDKDHSIAKADSQTDAKINAIASNNSLIKGGVISENTQKAKADGEKNSKSISISKGNIKSLSDLKADNNSKISSDINLVTKGDSKSKAKNGSFAIAQNKNEIKDSNKINSLNNSDIKIKSKGDSNALSNSKANENSASAAFSNTQAKLKNNLKALEDSLATGNFDIKSKGISDSKAINKGISSAISESKSSGDIEGLAEKKSEMILDLNNNDIAKSSAKSSGKRWHEKLPIPSKKIETVPTPIQTEVEGKTETEETRAGPVLKKEYKPEIGRKIIFECEPKYKRIDELEEKKHLEPLNQNGSKIKIPLDEYKEKGSLKDKIDNIVRKGKVKKETKPVLRADDKEQKVKKTEISPLNIDAKKDIITQPIIPITKEEEKLNYKRIDLPEAKPQADIDIKPKEKIDQIPIDKKTMTINIHDCKGPSAHHEYKEVDHKLFKEPSNNFGNDFFIGNKFQDPYHAHCSFAHPFFQNESMSKSPRYKREYPCPEPHYAEFGFGGFESERERIVKHPLPIGGKRKLRGHKSHPLDKKISAIPVNGEKDFQAEKKDKEKIAANVLKEKKQKIIDYPIHPEISDLTDLQDFKVSPNEINYQKVCHKICSEKNLPENSGSESKTGNDGVTLLRCTCGQIKTNWFKTEKPLNNELKIEEINGPEGKVKGEHCPIKIVKVEEKPIKKPSTKPILKAEGNRDKEYEIDRPRVTPIEPIRINMKNKVGDFIDKNANKIKGYSAHYLDAVDALTDKKIKESYERP